MEHNRQELTNRQMATMLSFLGAFIAGLFTLALYVGQSNDEDEKASTIKSFAEGKSFICPITPNSQTLLVSLGNGWKSYKEEYAIKGDVVQNLTVCQMQ